MKLLLFSDIHTSQSAAKQMVEKAARADVVIGAGDFCNLRRGLETIIEPLRAIQTPTILVPGNSESFEELSEVCEEWPAATVLHGSGTSIHGIPFFGIGGGIPTTPFGSWSYDFSEEEAAKLLSSMPENAVLISHSPPFGVVDISSSGMHLGSQSIRHTVETKTPPLVVCGHIHESAGRTEMIGNTPVVNAGPIGQFYELNPAC